MSYGRFRIQKADVDKETRIIAVSDVHGTVDYLEGILKKVNYTPKDILVIVGDLIEKGPDSLKTVRLVQKLMEESSQVYLTQGNVDYDRVGQFWEEGQQADYDFDGMLHWSKKVWGGSLFQDMMEEMGIDLEEVNGENICAVKKQIKENYSRELALFEDLPTILEIGNYIFVHAGIPTDDLEKLKEEDLFSYLKRDAFLKENVTFKKNVVVGHWPVCLYRDDVDSMNPIFDYEKHVVAIDGGCALKNGAQINALVLANAWVDLKEAMCVAYDDLPVIRANRTQAGKERTITIRFFDFKVELLEKWSDVARVRHVSTGKEFVVPWSYLYSCNNGLYNCSDFSDAWLQVTEGDELKVVQETAEGYIVKKDGIIGWYV